MTAGDVAWSSLFMAIFLPPMIGGLVGLFAVGEPSISSPTTWAAKLLGVAGIVVAIFMSWILSLLLFALLTRRFLSQDSYERWQHQFENGRARMPPLITFLGSFTFKIVRPKQVKSTL